MRQRDNNFSDEDFEKADSEANELASEATPLCPNCLKPVEPKQYYCPYCGSNEAINPLATYMPLIRIRHNYDIFITMWRKLWRKRIGSATIILFSFLTAVCVPIMLLGLPFIFWLILRDKRLRTYRLYVFALIVLTVFMTYMIVGQWPVLWAPGYRMSSHPVAPK